MRLKAPPDLNKKVSVDVQQWVLLMFVFTFHSRFNLMISWTSAVALSCEYSVFSPVHVFLYNSALESVKKQNKWEHDAFDVVSAATWTTARRSRFQRTTSTRGRRTSGRSALSCCGSWGKVAMERYVWCPRSSKKVHVTCTHSNKDMLWIILPLWTTVFLSAGFPSKESCWSCSGQNICHESFEEGTYFYFSLRWQREPRCNNLRKHMLINH